MKVSELEKFFYRNPSSKVHLRERSRELGMSTSYITENAEELIERGILQEERMGKMRVFSAATSSPAYRKSKKAFNLARIIESGLVERIEEELYPQAIVLFGSYLEGRDVEDSDIDIAVIGGREESINLSEFQEIFDREIHLNKLKSLENAEKEFKNTLVNGYVLSGYLEVL